MEGFKVLGRRLLFRKRDGFASWGRRANLKGMVYGAGVTGINISVLDLVGLKPGEEPGAGIGRSVDLAQHAEREGYKRFWMAEHHGIAGLAC